MDIHNSIMIIDNWTIYIQILNMDIHNSITDNAIMDIQNPVIIRGFIRVWLFHSGWKL